MEEMSKIKVVVNASECGVFLELGDRLLCLTAVRGVGGEPRVVLTSSDLACEEEPAKLEYSAEAFRDLLRGIAQAFWERLGIPFPL